MSVRYQFALNSENPEVVRAGLTEFIDQIYNDYPDLRWIKDSDVYSFQEMQEMFSRLRSRSSDEGVVNDFGLASPQFQEFFTVWSLHQGMEDPELTCVHMHCLSLLVLIRKDLAHRVLKHQSLQTINQLASKNENISIQTLFLVFSCVLMKAVPPDSLFEYLLDHFIYDSKVLKKWRLNSPNECNIKTLNPNLLFLLLFHEIVSGEPLQSSVLLSKTTLLEKLLLSLETYTVTNVIFILDSLQLLSGKFMSFAFHLPAVFQKTSLRRLFTFQREKNDWNLNSRVCEFFLFIIDVLLNPRLFLGKSKLLFEEFFAVIIDNINPVLLGDHRKIELKIMEISPSLRMKPFKKLKMIQWDNSSVASVEPHLQHLVDLLQSVSLRPTGLNENEVNRISFLLAAGLNKSSLTKLLLADNIMVKATAIDAYRSVFEEICRDEISNLRIFDTIPDLSFIPICWQRIANEFESLFRSQASVIESKNASTELESNLDILVNFDGLEETSLSNITPGTSFHDNINDKIIQLKRYLTSFLRLVNAILNSSVGYILVLKFDLLKAAEVLIDASIQDENSTVDLSHLELLFDGIKIATSFSTMRWFGQIEEINKLFNACIVSLDWFSSTSKSLSQLSRFILACTKLDQDQFSSCFWKAKNILCDMLLNLEKLVIADIRLENYNEIRLFVNFLFETVQRNQRSVFILDVFFRLASHYQVPVMLYSAQCGKFCLGSSLYLTGLLLICGDLTPFLKGLPAHIVKNFSAAISDPNDIKSWTFFEKFRKGFMTEFAQLFQSAIVSLILFSTESELKLNDMERFTLRMTSLDQSLFMNKVFDSTRNFQNKSYSFSTCHSNTLQLEPTSFSLSHVTSSNTFSKLSFGFLKLFEEVLSVTDLLLLNDIWKIHFQLVKAEIVVLKDNLTLFENCFKFLFAEIVIGLTYLCQCNFRFTGAKLQKSISKAVLQLSDLLCVELLEVASLTSSSSTASTTVIHDFLRISLLQDNFLLETPFGMICRRLIRSLLLENPSISNLRLNSVEFYLLKLCEFVHSYSGTCAPSYIRDASYLLLVECILESFLAIESPSDRSKAEFTKLLLTYYSWVLDFEILGSEEPGKPMIAKKLKLQHLMLAFLPRGRAQQSLVKKFALSFGNPASEIRYAVLPHFICTRNRIPSFTFVEPLMISFSNFQSNSYCSDYSIFKDMATPRCVVSLFPTILKMLPTDILVYSYVNRIFTTCSNSSTHEKFALNSEVQLLVENLYERMIGEVVGNSKQSLIFGKICLDLVGSYDKRVVFGIIISSFMNGLCDQAGHLFDLCFSIAFKNSISSLSPAYSDTVNQKYLLLQAANLVNNYPDHLELNITHLGLLMTWMKQILKHHIDNPGYLTIMQRCLQNFYNSTCSPDLVNFAELSFFHPGNLMHLITTHSKFKNIISVEGSNSNQSCSAIAVLQLIVILLSTLHSLKDGALKSFRKQISFVNCGSLSQILDYFQKLILSRYSGTMSEIDRLLFCIFDILQGNPQNSSSIQLPNIVLHKVLSGAKPISDIVVDFFRQNIVHDTLNSFPIRRKLSRGRFYFQTISSPNMKVESQIDYFLWLNHSEQASDGSYSTVYDPAFVTPLLYLCINDLYTRFIAAAKIPDPEERNLNLSAIKVRPFVNCGGLALVLAGLTSDCSSMRTVAWNALHKFSLLLHSQIGECDPSFSDRGNILMLISFLKNSVVLEETTIPQLPSVVAIFLAKASMILLLKQHTLYPEVGNYLLSKPYVDYYDVPLFDQIVFSSIGSTDLTAGKSITEDFSKVAKENIKYQKLQVLRLLRDSVKNDQDFSILTRKNVFFRLFLFYEDWADNDQRFGKIIIELIETCLTLSTVSFEHLLDRGEIFVWLFQRFSSLFSRNVSDGQERNWTAALSQIVRLLRKIINSYYLHYLSKSSASNINIKFYSDGFHQIQLFIRVLMKFLCSQRKAELLGVMELTVTLLYDNVFIFWKLLSDIARRFPEYENDFSKEIYLFPQIQFIFKVFNQYFDCEDSISKMENDQFKKILPSLFIICSKLLSVRKLTPTILDFIFEQSPEKLILFLFNELRAQFQSTESGDALGSKVLCVANLENFSYSLESLEIQGLNGYEYRKQYCNISLFLESKEWLNFIYRDHCGDRYEVIWNLHQNLEYEPTANSFPNILLQSFLFRSLIQYAVCLRIGFENSISISKTISESEEFYFTLASYLLYFYRMISPLFYDFSFELSNRKLKFPDSFLAVDPLQDLSLCDVWKYVCLRQSDEESNHVEFTQFLLYLVGNIMKRLESDFLFSISIKIKTAFDQVILFLHSKTGEIEETTEFSCSRSLMEIISVLLTSHNRLKALFIPDNKQSISEELEILQDCMELSLLSLCAQTEQCTPRPNKRKRKGDE